MTDTAIADTPITGKIMVCAMYKFTRLSGYRDLQQPMLQKMQSLGIRGTLLLAGEGFNGTIAAKPPDMRQFLHWLAEIPQLNASDHAINIKTSFTDQPPFKRSRVKLKQEIVTMGVPEIDPSQSAGDYVEPQDWNALIDDPDVVLIDTRNDYEIAVGRFDRSINPGTNTFREFPEYARANLQSIKGKKVAMYCTGGIRCEKSTALLKQMGVENVLHLKGGILAYLQHVPKHQSRWRGECFVFDERVTVDHDLQKGSYDQCHACRLPITEMDKKHEKYQPGTSCPHCHDRRSEADRERYAEREKQVELAQRRGKVHIGPPD